MSKTSKRLFSIATTEPQDTTPTTEAMISEIVADNNRLRRELKHARLELVRLKEEIEFGRAPLSPRSPSPDEEACTRGRSSFSEARVGSLGGIMAQEVEGGKRRKVEVGGPKDPEKRRDLRLPAAVKVGGVRWETGIGGVQAGLMEAGVEFCKGARWLVAEGPEEEGEGLVVVHCGGQDKRRGCGWAVVPHWPLGWWGVVLG